MIFLDVDGVLIDFKGTAAKFGIEVAPNDFSTWKWSGGENCPECKAKYNSAYCIFPKPEHFYDAANLQPWVIELIRTLGLLEYILLTKDNGKIKNDFFINKKTFPSFKEPLLFEAPYKSTHCTNPADLLIDDNAAECEAWRKKGGIAYHFDLAHSDPFGEFLKWWRLEK